MERTLIMIRHAKSSWDNATQNDFDRPLNERGKKDAPEMGKRLKKKGIVPDLIISSTAKRARSTAKKIAAALHYEEDAIVWIDKLYHCAPAVFEEVIYGIDAAAKTVFIVAHNPGITDFVNQQSPQFTIDNMPTCGTAGLRFDAEDWNRFSTAEKKVFLFDYPKNDHDA